VTQNFPREYKFTLGQDMKRDALVLLHSIYRGYDQDKPERCSRPGRLPSVSTSGETSWIVYSVSLEGMNEVV